MFRLKVLKGKNVGNIYEFDGEVFIGRSEYNDLQILDETTSRHHAKITPQDEYFVISDLGSHNGTFVNGIRIQSQILKTGDRILIGDTVLVFEAEPAKETASSPQAITVVKDTYEQDLKVEASLHSEEIFPLKHPEASSSSLDSQQRLKKLYQVGRILVEASTPTEIFRRVLDILASLMQVEKSYLLLLDENAETITSVIGPEPKMFSYTTELPLSRTIINQAITERKGLLVSNARLDETLKKRASIVRHKIGSVICLPLIFREKCLGVLYLESAPDKYVFAEEDLEFLLALGSQIALALEVTGRYTAYQEQLKEFQNIIVGRAKVIGKSKAFQEVLSLAYKIAGTNTTVLLLGETGTGKELIARLIHENSPRSNKPFIVINCAAIVETLLESELFGHEKGAFTGAIEKRKGKFELAHQSTIFLDEIGELSPNLQAKLLHVLEKKQFYTVGGTKPISVDVRIIAATNRDIDEMVKNNTFRNDLYYRLATVVIKLPPLRERKEDIPHLAYYFLEQTCKATKKRIQGISNEAMEILLSYRWPGNIRELQNVIEHAVVLCEGDRLLPQDLPNIIKTTQQEVLFSATPVKWKEDNFQKTPVMSLKESEKFCILKALEYTGWKKGEAARILGISWPTLNKKMEEYGIKIKGED